MSRGFAVRSLVVVLSVVVGLSMLPELQIARPEPENERLILVIFGGLLVGTAKAIAFRNRGSTGDEDIPGAYFAMKYLKPVGSIAIAAAIVSTSFGLFFELLKHGRLEPVVNTLMYTCVFIFASTETLNNLYRKFQITMLVVITREYQKVAAGLNEIAPHRTYTIQDGIGGRSGEPYRLMRTIITREELPRFVEAVERSDSECFYFYHDIEGISRRYYIEPIG